MYIHTHLYIHLHYRLYIYREHATQMKNVGVSSLLHKYARSDAASAVEGTQKNFYERSQQIWKRQKEALSLHSPGIYIYVYIYIYIYIYIYMYIYIYI
jgi:hypothetical protein